MAYTGILILDDLAVTVKCRTAMEALSRNFNLCVAVKLDSLTPITNKVVSSNPLYGKVYSIQHYVIKFVSD
jgi:hypothetical protein